MKLFISLRPKIAGGGANAFAYNFAKWIKKNNKEYKAVRNILHADKAIIIADKADINKVQKAKNKGCFIIHRLDEYFEQVESEYRRRKHQKIIELNRLADVTVYQSNFVFNNVHPYLKTNRYKIILNGADPELFCPAPESGEYIGHVSWGVDTKKRLDILYKFITEHPDQKFLLIGRHKESPYNFNLSNVILKGVVKRKKLPRYYRMMKMLYFPSENDPCPNTAIEAILSGVPICYNPAGGTIELVKNCGEPLDNVEFLLENLADYRSRCSARKDLYFDQVFERYLNV